jgi:hypothetical protein
LIFEKGELVVLGVLCGSALTLGEGVWGSSCLILGKGVDGAS